MEDSLVQHKDCDTRKFTDPGSVQLSVVGTYRLLLVTTVEGTVRHKWLLAWMPPNPDWEMGDRNARRYWIVLPGVPFCYVGTLPVPTLRMGYPPHRLDGGARHGRWMEDGDRRSSVQPRFRLVRPTKPTHHLTRK